MMTDTTALRVAIDLMNAPSRLRAARSSRLPTGVPLLLRIAAREEAAQSEAAEAIGRSEEIVRKAALFFIEQILLDPEAESYRILGTDRQASAAELRRNMALLLKGLHPDFEQDEERSVLASRVTRAWDDLKTPARRAAHDRASTITIGEKPCDGRPRGIVEGETRRGLPAGERKDARRSRRLAESTPERQEALLRLVLFLFGHNKARNWRRLWTMFV